MPAIDLAMKAFSGDPSAAWAPYRSGGEQPWDLKAAGHLFRRAGFGANWGELQRALSDGPAKTIDRLFQPEGDVEAFHREADSFESDGQNVQGVDELRGSWLRRMIATPDPLREKMTLFWHSWFGVGATQSPALALAHVRMLRKQALGRFDDLLLAAVRDPAVLVSAGGQENPKSKPNLLFARRMLACFTVGRGQFTERDVTETARAFTGLFVRSNQLRDLPRDHDEGEKTILGQTGPWTAQDFARIASSHPATARHLVRGLYRWLICDQTEPADDLIEPLARSFGADRDIGKLVNTMLRSNLFFSAVAYKQRVKCPVEFAVGLCHAFEAQVPAVRLGHDVGDLGQELYQPPTVEGWPGGRTWINPATLAGRANLAAALLGGSGGYENRLDPTAIAQKHGRGAARQTENFLSYLLIQEEISPDVQKLLNASTTLPKGPRAIATLLAASPEYQLA